MCRQKVIETYFALETNKCLQGSHGLVSATRSFQRGVYKTYAENYPCSSITTVAH